MKKTLFFLLLLLATTTMMAQTAINGRVKDKKTGESLSFVTVILTKQGSTKPVKNAITDESGRFNIANIQNGNYTVSVSFMGYKPYNKNIQATGAKINLGTINLAEEATSLKEVTVTGQRSSVKLEVDRKSFDVSQDIANAGASASEVLENIPSVEVDQDGNVSLRGNESVEVWINGRQSGLTADNRGDILKQIPAETIERIEVIDNPSAKFSAEGSAGIINIILKKERKAGYFGSASVGGDTRGGANANVNINYNSSKLDLFGSIGYRHMQNKGRSESDQHNYEVVNGVRGKETQHSWNNTENENFGNNVFIRAGGTWHITDKDDLGVASNLMKGGHNRYSTTPYYNKGLNNNSQLRKNRSNNNMLMQYYELNYRHTWSPTNTLDFVANYSNWGADNSTIYQDRMTDPLGNILSEGYTSQPMDIENKRYELKLDYEGNLSERLKLQTGYQANFSRENTPIEQWTAEDWNGTKNYAINKTYYNRFLYNQDTHALYATLSWNVTDKFSAMAGLRGEYWKVKTDSYDYYQDKEGKAKDPTYNKDFFKLFPSLFLSYQLTKRDQLQVNYTRRLRRPWGGELNSFMNTDDPTSVRYGNPELTPEFSNSFSLNYLRQWDNHSLLISAYYRPTTDVMSRVSYIMDQTLDQDDRTFSTSMNTTKSVSSGLEFTMKNKFFKRLDLTTTANFYNKHVDDFDFMARNPLFDGNKYKSEFVHVSGKGDDNFTWNARMQASLMLPWDMSVQLSGRYRSKEIVTQGYRNANFTMQAGIRKNFLHKLLTVSLNCRDLLNSRKRESFTDATGFTRHQLNRWGGRSVNLSISFNFGNMMPKMPKMKRQDDNNGGGEDDGGSFGGYEM